MFASVAGAKRNRSEAPFILTYRATYLPLSREVTVTRGDTEEEGVELRELLRLDDLVGDGELVFLGSMHFAEDLLVERLGDAKQER